jgi:hypothetical protein
MAVLKFMFLLIAVRSSTVSSSAIGQGIELRKYDIVGAVVDSGSPIFAKVPKNCVIAQEAYQSKNTITYYKDTKSFYKSIGTKSGIDAKLQSDYTLGFTLDATTKSVSGSSRNVSGNTLLTMASASKDILKSSCLYNQPLGESLVEDLSRLPTTIKRPWWSSSWEDYDRFLTKYGSHVVSTIVYGSSISQMSFAEFTSDYSQKDFEINSCVKLVGPGASEEKMNSISVCTGVTKEEIDKSSTYSMSDTLVVNGGSPETRNELLEHRTNELVHQFLNEANFTRSPIDYAYMPIWELIQGHVDSSKNDQLRAINMEQYYFGYLSYGCTFMQVAEVYLQQFDISPQATPSTPRYQCTLAAEGCHSHSDCAYRLVKCKCQSNTCVRYRDVTEDTGLIKTVPYINAQDKWYWNGCDWKVKGSKCECKHPDSTRFVVWNGDNKADVANSRASAGVQLESEKKQEL